MDKRLNKKSWMVIMTVMVVVIAIGIGWILKGQKTNDELVYVENVGTLMGYNQGQSNLYMGKVEATQIQNIMKSGGVVDEIYVSVGDHVSAGEALFSYDSDEASTEIQKLNLDIEGFETQIKTLESQIETLKVEKEKAPETEQYQYTMDIQAKELEIKQLETNKQATRQQIESYQTQINEATVTSKIDGVVKSINEEDSSQPLMSIMATDGYKIKGEVSEQNIMSLTEGASVIVHSRVDQNKQWKGTIQMIDTDNTIPHEEGQPEISTKYPFYVILDSTDGLLLGQHVYIDINPNQAVALEGVWLDPSYIVMEEDEAFVWIKGKKNTLEKQPVTLGDNDESQMLIEIKSGLSLEDAIAWPVDGLYEGMKVGETNAS